MGPPAEWAVLGILDAMAFPAADSDRGPPSRCWAFGWLAAFSLRVAGLWRAAVVGETGREAVAESLWDLPVLLLLLKA